MTGVTDASTLIESVPPPADVRLTYGEQSSQFVDLRLASRAGPAPLVILMHGGYWRARYDLAYFGHVAGALAADGFATCNLEYRRVGEVGGGWPGTFDDVRAGIAFARNLHERYPIDPRRTVLLGHSAGGHLALWAAADLGADPVARHGLTVVALAPVADLHEAWARRLSNGAAAELLGGGPDELPDRYAAACPGRRLPLGVPVRVAHGTADGHVPFDLSAAYVERARGAGDDVDLVALDGAGHFEMVDPTSVAFATVRRLVHAAVGAG